MPHIYKSVAYMPKPQYSNLNILKKTPQYNSLILLTVTIPQILFWPYSDTYHISDTKLIFWIIHYQLRELKMRTKKGT